LRYRQFNNNKVNTNNTPNNFYHYYNYNNQYAKKTPYTIQFFSPPDDQFTASLQAVIAEPGKSQISQNS